MGIKQMMQYCKLAAVFYAVALSSALAGEVISRTFPSSAGTLKVETVAKGLENPWSLAFMPNGNMLVTERPGRMRIVTKKGEVQPPIEGVPTVYAEGQGGLLDVILHPQFSQNHQIYFSYAEEVDNKAGTAVASATLKNNKLENVKVIFRQLPKVKGPNHWGSRLVYAGNETLFVTLGERYDHADKAQDLSNHLGKIVRIETDGSLIPSNPFAKDPGLQSEIWSYGHRNIQGAALHPVTRQLWIHEHGARGGDEVNIIEPGKNYGWPNASYGSHYSMIPIPDDHAGRGYVEPLYHWTPSIAPSGMLFYTGNKIKGWRYDLFTGALAGMSLIRLQIENDKVVHEERLLTDLGERIRDVRQGPDGLIYLLTDSEDGQILRLEPAI